MNAGSQQLITSTGSNWTVLYDPSANNGGTNALDLPCTTFFISANASNTAQILANVPSMHGTNALGIGAGVTIPLRFGSNAMPQIRVQASASSGAAIDFGICSHL